MMKLNERINDIIGKIRHFIPVTDTADEIAQLEEENAALKRGVQDIRDISGTEWGRREMDSPWGKALFLIMQKCEALLADTKESE